MPLPMHLLANKLKTVRIVQLTQSEAVLDPGSRIVLTMTKYGVQRYVNPRKSLALCVGRLVIHQSRNSARVVVASASGEQRIPTEEQVRKHLAQPPEFSDTGQIACTLHSIEGSEAFHPILILVVYAEGYVNSAPT